MLIRAAVPYPFMISDNDEEIYGLFDDHSVGSEEAQESNLHLEKTEVSKTGPDSPSPLTEASQSQYPEMSGCDLLKIGFDSANGSDVEEGSAVSKETPGGEKTSEQSTPRSEYPDTHRSTSQKRSPHKVKSPSKKRLTYKDPESSQQGSQAYPSFIDQQKEEIMNRMADKALTEDSALSFLEHFKQESPDQVRILVSGIMENMALFFVAHPPPYF